MDTTQLLRVMRCGARRTGVLIAALVALTAGAARASAQSPASIADAVVAATWQGVLHVGPSALRLALTVRRDSTGALTGFMTSIDQGGAQIPSTFAVRADTLLVTMPAVSASFAGVLNAARDTLAGLFRQGGGALPLAMARGPVGAALPVAAHPQEPKPPFPYRTEEVSFASVPGVRLAGTLALPTGRGSFPTMVLVTGSGPQDRDEALMGHKPFLVLADYLARRGIATLRYDDRGVAKSTGNFALGTSADFADDAEAAVRFLRTAHDVAADRIGILGHSEGGMIAPLVAARSRDVAFVVMLAGPGIPGDSILLLQSRAIMAAAGAPTPSIDQGSAINRRLYAALLGASDSADAERRIQAVEKEIVATLPSTEQGAMAGRLSGAHRQLMSPWMRYFLAYDPRPTLRKVRVPVLALNGTLDLQVTSRENLRAIGDALKAGGNRNYEVVELPGLNHLFQTARTGAVSEYSTIEETMAPVALDRIASWIARRFVRP